ncbi:A-kinase anchor protein 5 [Ochotona princeps]|uniref:A-kinase anchor protein 5 n=1 Tax=Ochotona princeps TaxID=9978 RepID=UPI002714B20C|nr:A-kinase anchor protein 5 [Ochotona princeps]
MKNSRKTESKVSEIQVENRDEKRLIEAGVQDEGRAGKAPTLCFKRRKKPRQVQGPPAGSEEAVAGAGKGAQATGASTRTPQPAGAWASFKRLVTRRKRPDSSPQALKAEVQPAANAEGAQLQKKKAKARLKMPCINFPRGTQRGRASRVAEGSDRAQGETEGLGTQTATQAQSNDQAPQARLAQEPTEDFSHESRVSDQATSGEQVIAVELGSGDGHPLVATAALVLERNIETTQEAQDSCLQPAGPLESPEVECQGPGAPETHPRDGAETTGALESRPSPKIPEPHLREEAAADGIPKSRPTPVISGAEATTAGVPESRPSPEVSEPHPRPLESGSSPEVSELHPGLLESQPSPEVPGPPESQPSPEVPKPHPGPPESRPSPEVSELHPEPPESRPSPEVPEPHPEPPESQPTPIVPGAEAATDGSLKSQESQLDRKNGSESQKEVPEDRAQPEATASSQELDGNGSGTKIGKAKLEDGRRMEPIAIIITDTEISEFDAERATNVPKPFLMSVDEEAADGAVEGRTSEQYESLLMETASSLVKNAIQLSVEQLVNEMAADDNKINSPLQ